MILTNTYQNDTRRADDFYRTPNWCADIGARIAVAHGKRILDPCAGDGSLMQAAERAGGTAVGIELDMVRATAAQCECADAMHPDAVWPDADVILMNPPFALWQQFTARAVTKDVLAVVVLLRLGALAGQKRRDWWLGVSKRWGVTANVLSKRPSFTGKGSDSADYVWLELSRDMRTGVRWA